MGAPTARGPGGSLPGRTRPPQVVLAVGAVLVVTAATALASAYGAPTSRWALLVAAGVVAGLSLSAGRAGLRSASETLAVTTTGLALAGTAADGAVLDGEPVTPLLVLAAFLLLHVLAPAVTTWPVGAWAAFQVAVVRLLDELPAAVTADVRLLVALVGLGIAVGARRRVARVALATTAPWWVLGVAGGSADVWSGEHAGAWMTAALIVLAGAVLVPARLRPELEPLLGPRRLAPLTAGAVSGIALTGVLSPGGTVAWVVAGWLGVVLASAARVLLHGWRRGLLLPAAGATGVVTTALCAVQLLQERSWGALSLLLLLVALPPAAVSVVRRADRHVAVPISTWCLSGSVLLAVPADVLSPGTGGLLLAGICAAALGLGSGVAGDVRRPTARAAALTGVAAVALALTAGDRGMLAAVLAVQGLATLGWAWRLEVRTGGRTGGRTGMDAATAAPADPVADELSAGWKVGAAQLVVASWAWAAVGDVHLLEAWTLPLAAGLLGAAGPRLLRAPSWPAWGPGLVVAVAPSTVGAVLEPDGWRPVWVLSASVLLLVGGGARAVLAPLVVGAVAPVVLVLGLAVPALPWPLTASLVAGGGLLAWGTLREGRPVGGFRLRLAQLR